MTKNWLGKLFHMRDDEGDFTIRALVHIPVGILIGLCLLSESLFVKYELNEDRHTKDEAWKDMFGAMVGRVIGRTLLICAIIYVILRWVL